MKSLKALLLASLALAFSAAARAESSAQAWLETYYLNPRPAELSANVHSLSRTGWFDEEGHTAISIGFLSGVFAANPQRVNGWLEDLADLPLTHRRLIAASLWQAGNPMGAEMLKRFAKNSVVRNEVLELASRSSTPVSNTLVVSTSSMNLQWGAFLASGNERHVVAILDGMGNDRAGLDISARQTLAQNAVAHPRVLDICRAQLSRQPESVRAEIRAALTAAGFKPGA